MNQKDFTKVQKTIYGVVPSQVYLSRLVCYSTMINHYHYFSSLEIFNACIALSDLCTDYAKLYKIDLVEKSKAILNSKAEEYSSDKDRLWNFKNNYAWQSSDPKSRLAGYLEKHLVSFADIIEGKIVPEAILEEKIIDIYNYAILLLALCKEELDMEVANDNSN